METTRGFKRILLATDGSEQSEAAAEAAISLAHATSAVVHVIHVWNLEVHHRHGFWDVEVRSEAEQLVNSVVSRLQLRGIQADGEICHADSGHVADAIAGAARAFAADLVIVGSRGLSDWESMIKHSVSHHVLSSVSCPVLVVRSWAPQRDKHGLKVLLAIAGGEDIAPGVRAAVAAASEPGSQVLVVHVKQAFVAVQGVAYIESSEEVSATMATAIKLLREAGVAAEAVVAHDGPVARVIAEMASGCQADMIVTGSSRAGDLASALLGSVSHYLLHISDRPVLIAEHVKA